jgi:phosphoglycolate phosphatase
MSQHAHATFEALIFDLDGTLIDSAPRIAAAVNAYLAEQGHAALEVAQVERFIGNGPRRLIEDILVEQGVALGTAELDAAVASYIAYYRRNPASHTRFFPMCAKTWPSCARPASAWASAPTSRTS